jgi:hypothetical protein
LRVWAALPEGMVKSPQQPRLRRMLSSPFTPQCTPLQALSSVQSPCTKPKEVRGGAPDSSSKPWRW